MLITCGPICLIQTRLVRNNAGDKSVKLMIVLVHIHLINEIMFKVFIVHVA